MSTAHSPKVLDCQAVDNLYLHKDFHGALCYAIKYLDDRFGQDATGAYLRQVGQTVYQPLIEKLRSQGLAVLEHHLRHIFTLEEGQFSLRYEGDTLVLEVQQCPAVAHLKKINQFHTDRFCETTVIVNETICRAAGFDCSCEYQPGKGVCVQKFWKRSEGA